MLLRTLSLLLILASVAVGVPAPAQDAAPASVASAAIQGGRIRIEIGRSHLLQDVASYDVTDPSVVKAEPTQDGNLILKGQAPGTTQLLIRKPGLLGHIVYTIDVIGVNVENVLRVVKEALGGIVGLTIRKEGNVVVLEGNVISRNDGKRVDRQIEFNGSAILDLTERVYLQNDLALLRDELKRSKYEGIEAETQIARDGQRILLIRGTVASAAQQQSVIGIAQKFFEEKDIVDQIKLVEPQIEVDVEIYTLDMTRSRSMGTNTMLAQVTSTDSTGWLIQGGPKARTLGWPIEVPTAPDFDNGQRFENQLPGGNQRVRLYPQISTGAFSDEFINALIADDVVTHISKQHVAVRSDQEADVNNVRDSYIAITSKEDASLEKVTSGQVLKIKPTILENGSFETVVEMELSGIVDVVDSEALAVARRSVSSTFISGQDEKVVIGGNKRVSGSDTEDSTPILRWIPIVNWLFKAKTRANEDTMQVFFMTLRTPKQFPAEDVRQSEPALEQRDSVREQMGKTKKKLDFWLRWN